MHKRVGFFGENSAPSLLHGIATMRERGGKPSMPVLLLRCRQCLMAYQIGSSRRSSTIFGAGPSRNGSRFSKWRRVSQREASDLLQNSIRGSGGVIRSLVATTGAQVKSAALQGRNLARSTM